MSSVLDIGICVVKGARACVEMMNYFYSEPYQRPGTKTQEVAQRVDDAAKGAIVLLEIAKCFVKPEVQSVLCKTEAGIRVIKAASHFYGSYREGDSLDMQKAVLAEAGSEVLGALRGLSEGIALDQQELLKLSDEEIAKNIMPITEYDYPSDRMIVVGYRPMTRQDCQSSLDENLVFSGVCSATELGTRIFSLCKRTEIDQQRAAFIAAGAPLPPQGIGIQAQVPYLGPDSMFDFLQWKQIPTELQEDPVLRTIQCPITFAPIRFAAIVRGAPAQHVFEKSMLINHLLAQTAQGIATTHPLTRAPMALTDVIDDVATQGIIDARLRKLSATLRARHQATIEQDVVAVPV